MSQESEDEYPFDDDDVPWASPEIQINYEAALGRFILSFNRLDNFLTEIIETVLKRLDRKDLINACVKRDFNHKLLVLDLLKDSREGKGLKNIVVDNIRRVGRERNILAHGHFDQNPVDGSYDIVTVKTRAQYPIEKLDDLRQKADQSWDQLRSSSAYYAFCDVTQEIN